MPERFTCTEDRQSVFDWRHQSEEHRETTPSTLVPHLGGEHENEDAAVEDDGQWGGEQDEWWDWADGGTGCDASAFLHHRPDWSGSA